MSFRDNKNKIAKMSKEFETEWTNLPTCPHCGEQDRDWWDGRGLENDGDQKYVECGACGKEHRITIHVTVEFTTEKLEETEESHE